MGKQIADKNSPEKRFLKRSNVVLGTGRVYAFMLHAASLYQSKRAAKGFIFHRIQHPS